MKRLHLILVAAVLFMAIGTVARPQMGMEFFKKPAIASLIRPVVGSGGVYETTSADQPSAAKSTMEWLVVGKEMADGKDAFWLEIGHQMKGLDGMVYSKVLISKDDFQLHRSIMQLPGRPAMEMKVNPSSKANQRYRRRDEQVDPGWHGNHHSAGWNIFVSALEKERRQRRDLG